MKKESFSINGESLIKKVKELINEGDVNKITITDKSGKELASFPVTVGVVGILILPMLAAIGAIAALVSECTITVERDEEKSEIVEPLRKKRRNNLTGLQSSITDLRSFKTAKPSTRPLKNKYFELNFVNLNITS